MSTFSTLLCFLYCNMSTLSTLLRYVCIFPRCCAISTILLCHVYLFHTHMLCLFFHAVAQCLLLSYHCTLSTFFHSAALCLLFPHCCAMSTFSTLLCHVYFFHQAALCLLFHQAAPCLHFQHCTVMSTFPTLLRHDYLFHDAGTLLFSHCAARCQLWYVSFLRAAVLCLFSLLLCHVYISAFLCYVSFSYTCMMS